MQESVIYQELRAEAREEVRQEERLEGERRLILRQLTRQVGELPQLVQAQIEALAIAQLEALGEALLDFTEIADLEYWLQAHR